MIDAALDLSGCPALRSSRDFSRDLLRRAAATLHDAGEPGRTAVVAVCGSLGRLEAGPHSDLDCIVVADGGRASHATGALADRVGQALAALGLKASKPWGIYRRPVDRASLLAPAALGSLEEPAEIFGKRLQLLLDARPVLHAGAFARLQSDIVDWYATGFLEAKPGASWTYLINDLSRYLHSYGAWQQYKFARTPDDSWQLRQAKFRSTRLVTLAGLLVLLGESNRDAGKREWLVEHLALSPLERLGMIMKRYDRAAFAELLATYEALHALMSDPPARADLLATGPDSPAGLAAKPGDVYARVHELSAAVIRLLTRFILDRRSDWDPRFFERLIL